MSHIHFLANILSFVHVFLFSFMMSLFLSGCQIFLWPTHVFHNNQSLVSDINLCFPEQCHSTCHSFSFSFHTGRQDGCLWGNRTLWYQVCYLSCIARKKLFIVICWTTKAQTCLHFCTIWSARLYEEHSGSEVECLTRDQGFAGLSLIMGACVVSLSMALYHLLSPGSTQKNATQHDWKMLTET